MFYSINTQTPKPKGYKLPRVIRDYFGVPIQVGDRVLKKQISKFGSSSTWFLVVDVAPDGSYLLTRKLNIRNGPRSHVGSPTYDNSTKGAGRQYLFKTYDGETKAVKRIISPRVSKHTYLRENSLLIDHGWRTRRNGKLINGCVRFGNERSVPAGIRTARGGDERVGEWEGESFFRHTTEDDGDSTRKLQRLP